MNIYWRHLKRSRNRSHQIHKRLIPRILVKTIEIPEQCKSDGRDISRTKWHATIWNSSSTATRCVINFVCQTWECDVRPWCAYHQIGNLCEISFPWIAHFVDTITMCHAVSNTTASNILAKYQKKNAPLKYLKYLVSELWEYLVKPAQQQHLSSFRRLSPVSMLELDRSANSCRNYCLQSLWLSTSYMVLNCVSQPNPDQTIP